MKPKGKKPTQPRVTIYESGRSTLSGVEYHDLRSIIAEAALHNYASLERARKTGDKEAEGYAREQLQLIDRVEAAVMQAIAASHRAAPSERTGWRRPVARPLRDLPRADRRRLVEHEREGRQWLDRVMATLDAERAS